MGQAGQQLTGEQVLSLLRSRQLLLILDNCEGVLEQLAFIPDWLKRAPHLAILATSREPLNFQAESVVSLQGLRTGDAEALFVERARMARTEFAADAATLPLVRQICQLVEGSPLAIALAAAWVRRRSLAQIIASLRQSLDLLSTRLRDSDPRHHSMRAVLDTSWQLLDPGGQAVLAALSLFPTTFSAEAAAHVAGATLAELDQLCEKSLLHQQHEIERYAMHSLVRQFARSKLAQRERAVQHAFADYFHHFARAHQHDYAALQPEWGNLLAAIGYAHALSAWDVLLDSVQLLDEPWFRQIRFNDMRAALVLALEAATALDRPADLAKTLLRLGEIEMEQNDYAAADAHLSQALAHFTRLEEAQGIAHATYFLGRIRSEQSQDAQAAHLLEKARRLFEEESDWLGTAKTLNILALCFIKSERDFASAHVYLGRSAALQHALPPSATYVETLRHLARVKGWAGALADAEQCLVEASRVSQQLQDRGEYGAVLYERVLLCKQCQQWDRALAFGYDCLEIFQKLGSLRWEALIKTQLGLLHQARNEPQQGLALLTESLHLFGELGDAYEQAYSYYYLHTSATRRSSCATSSVVIRPPVPHSLKVDCRCCLIRPNALRPPLPQYTRFRSNGVEAFWKRLIRKITVTSSIGRWKRTHLYRRRLL